MREGNFGLISWMPILLCIYYGYSAAEDDSRQTFVIRYKDGEQTIPVTVVLDYKKQTEYVINMNPRAPAKSVTLYDFKQRTIAYKDLTNRECFLGRLTHETLNEESNALNDVQSPVESKPKVRSLDPERPALTPTEIRNIAGQKTAVFCRKMNTWLLMPEKTHGIHKREVDDFEERTYEHHGTHTVHYSHFGKETRRRYRNPNSRHRSHRRQSAANTDHQRQGILEHDRVANNPSIFATNHNLTKYSDSSFAEGPSIDETHDTSSGVVDKPYGSNFENSGTEEDSPSSKTSSNESHTHKNHFNYQINYPSFNAEFSSSDSSAIKFPQQSYISSLDNKKNSVSNAEENSDLQKTFDEPYVHTDADTQNSLQKDNINVRTERATSTTDVPSSPNSGIRNHPHVHPSLQHLLPIYKPLSQEFNFDSPYVYENETSTHDNNKERKIESEFNPPHKSQRQLIENNFISHVHSNLSVEHPDVSTNALEVQRITNKFENISTDENYKSEPQENHGHRNYLENQPLTPPHDVYFSNRYLSNRNSPPIQRIPFHENDNEDFSSRKTYLSENSPLHFTTSEVPTYTTAKYFPVEKSPDLFAPVVHSTFENTEDLSSFEIFPHNVVAPNVYDSSTSLKNESLLKTPEERTGNSYTTKYPIIDKRNKFDSHLRSDLPSEENDRNSLSSNSVLDSEKVSITPFPTVLEARINYFTSPVSNKTANDSVTPYRNKYQSALRDFKPDEIVIDVENIPTQPPASVTSSFRQRKPIIQPPAKLLPENVIRSDPGGWNEQLFVTTFRSFTPTTTTTPRRRLNDRTRRPSHGINSHSGNNLYHPNRPHSTYSRQQNQLNRVREFQPPHFLNRPQTFYPNRGNPRYHLRTENQVPPFNELGNLPPGVSVHPRHPQAPYADMVLSNRPPTMPLITDHRNINRPHRQRHHRNKEHLKNSCCRLRGKPSSFQSCCRNGGPCCTAARRRMQSQGTPCCSPGKVTDQIIPANQIQPPLINDEVRVNKSADKERCQKEKMCRTLYESTQKVMVCRNAHIEGC